MSGALTDHLGKALSNRIRQVQFMLAHIEKVGPQLPEPISKNLTESLHLIPLQLEQVTIDHHPELLTAFSDIVEECSSLLKLYTESICNVPYDVPLAVIPEDIQEGSRRQNLSTRFKTLLGKLNPMSRQKEGKANDLCSKIEACANDLEKLSKVDLKRFPIPIAVGQESRG